METLTEAHFLNVCFGEDYLALCPRIIFTEQLAEDERTKSQALGAICAKATLLDAIPTIAGVNVEEARKRTGYCKGHSGYVCFYGPKAIEMLLALKKTGKQVKQARILTALLIMLALSVYLSIPIMKLNGGIPLGWGDLKPILMGISAYLTMALLLGVFGHIRDKWKNRGGK